MNYLVAVLPDRIQAEAAYSALEKEGLPTSQICILGKGYKSIEDLGIPDPAQAARRQAKLMAIWLVPFGFIAGVAFNLSTQYNLVPQVGPLGNHLLGGVFGAVAGAMGSFFVGAGTKLTSEGDDGFPFLSRLKSGKYLVVVQGAPNLTNQATKLLKPFSGSNIQSYVAAGKKF